MVDYVFWEHDKMPDEKSGTKTAHKQKENHFITIIDLGTTKKKKMKTKAKKGKKKY